MKNFAMPVIKLSLHSATNNKMTLNDIHGNETVSFIWIEQYVETVTAVSKIVFTFSALYF